MPTFLMNETPFLNIFLELFTTGYRPIMEDHPLHAAGISTLPEDRISYPNFVNYVPDDPTLVLEDVHQAGMIISHLLTTLKRDLMNTCEWSHKEAANKLFNVILETYTYLGDLSATGNDFYPTGTVNLSPDLDQYGTPSSLLWYSRVRPINFRSWIQTFGRFFVHTIASTTGTACNGKVYAKDSFEQILDSYGLLLFDNYNDDGNHHAQGHGGSNHVINPENRLKTVMIDKNLIDFDKETPQASTFLIKEEICSTPSNRYLI